MIDEMRSDVFLMEDEIEEADEEEVEGEEGGEGVDGEGMKPETDDSSME